jgi:hypothetical protein
MQFRLAGFNFLNHPLISFSGQDPSNPLSLVIGDCPPNQNPCPVYTTLQQALNGMVVMNGGGYSFGQTKFKSGNGTNRVLEAGFKYNF